MRGKDVPIGQPPLVDGDLSGRLGRFSGKKRMADIFGTYDRLRQLPASPVKRCDVEKLQRNRQWHVLSGHRGWLIVHVIWQQQTGLLPYFLDVTEYIWQKSILKPAA
tara:strand:- start:226295 stop:226615 length:321 start_codon:yes stop_codon:yes gene_type:complete